ncbi:MULTISPECIES: DUF6233 domain-containing protein [unclassified Streptomyces]|uniref:DUF6233 domain-containing protein n=1 Tax=unclassified Streptomyces TaxID=2593676 RepID=UPI0035DA923C
MNEPDPTRLTVLRFLERVQLRDLARTRKWIKDEERRAAEEQCGIEARPAPPDWLLERGLNGHSPPVYVHTGDCWNVGRNSTGIEQEQARQAIATGIKACPHCRPDTALHMLD